MSEFVENLNDVFCQFGPVSVRRMFGGYGVYHDGVMFGLVADDVLYLKVDGESMGRFTELDLEPFEYEKNGAKIKMSYYMAPESIFEDSEEAKEWAELAFHAALRARKPAARTKANKK
ncbi:TfoX/Sxy family protein [uncultured Marinobacter sp.]|jgi:DNA transformation protein|uniref:TfoX/Sxy family protein n=1 Tax=uncultured Marinobacter sp. TaxID=187379 RepID=UPI00258360B9|nr:TfoX/Sxy family protein [uncultured Marinobacter sp.]